MLFSSDFAVESCYESARATHLIPGMTVRNYRGFPSLLEVECSGSTLELGEQLFSLVVFTVDDNNVIAFANHLNCLMSKDFSLCVVDTGDSRKSLLRVLVSDLEEDEARLYGCNVTSFVPTGMARIRTWSVLVKRDSEYLIAY